MSDYPVRVTVRLADGTKASGRVVSDKDDLESIVGDLIAYARMQRDRGERVVRNVRLAGGETVTRISKDQEAMFDG